LALGNDGFHEEDFELLARIEKGHFWFDSRNELITWALGRYFPAIKSFLEIGCGDGYVLSWIEREKPELSLTGSEVYESGLNLAERRLKKTELFQMDARKIPFSEEFDVVGAFDVLEHIQEDELVLSQMHQAVRKGGGILLSVPQHRFLWSDADKFSFHVRRYEALEMRKKVEKAGFQVVLSTSFVFFLLPAMMISRFLSKGKVQENGPKVELNLSPFLNCIFKWVLNLEILLIKWGVRLPLGGSLLLAARKI
jgi:2-polyprenyl-3-methyl-5-hydroxy-6-metoxy-1,4-benzoquinol methylase